MSEVASETFQVKLDDVKDIITLGTNEKGEIVPKCSFQVSISCEEYVTLSKAVCLLEVFSEHMAKEGDCSDMVEDANDSVKLLKSIKLQHDKVMEEVAKRALDTVSEVVKEGEREQELEKAEDLPVV